jgi:hypothetical protein
MPDLTKLRRSTDPRIRAAVWDVDTAPDDSSRTIRLHLLSLMLEGRA